MRHLQSFVAFVLAGAAIASTATGQPATQIPKVVISNDRRSLDVTPANSQRSKRVDVLAFCGDPAIGPAAILAFSIDGETIFVHYGKHCEARISIPDLKLSCAGCD